MRHAWKFAALAAPLVMLGVAFAEPPPPGAADAPAYTAGGDLQFPADYRRWVFLSSGFNMSYVPVQAPGMNMFDNTFANPSAYAAFEKTGTWPDKTVIVLEARLGADKGSINKAGAFQTERMAMEVHVKDTARFPGGWAFFEFPTAGAPGKILPQTASCYACHAAHAAVDTTFVQFYPTLKPIAAADHTFSAAYLADEAAAH